MTTTATQRRLPVIDEATWQRMSWRARQRWLLAANALRLQLVEDIAAARRLEAARAAQREHMHAATLEAAQAILDALGPDPNGHAHLETLARATGDGRPSRRTPEYRAANAKRQRDLRARRRDGRAA